MAEVGRRVDPDAELVRSVQAGSIEAFSELFRRHYPSIMSACLRRLRNPVDADEAAQATFVRALERIDQCKGERRFAPWVHVIAQRLCVDTIRARARTQPEERPVPMERHRSRAGDPEESVLDREQARHLQEALDTLPPRQREAVVARTLDERRPGEIAESLGLSVGAVDSLLLRGRRRLAHAYRQAAAEQSAPAASGTPPSDPS